MDKCVTSFAGSWQSVAQEQNNLLHGNEGHRKPRNPTRLQKGDVGEERKVDLERLYLAQPLKTTPCYPPPAEFLVPDQQTDSKASPSIASSTCCMLQTLPGLRRHISRQRIGQESAAVGWREKPPTVFVASFLSITQPQPISCLKLPTVDRTNGYGQHKHII